MSTSSVTSMVDLWWTDLDSAPTDQSLLSADERERAARFRLDTARAQYQRSRGWLRTVLAGYIGSSPGGLEFEYGPMGKPSLTGPAGELEFSLAHSGPLALLAVTKADAVGVDIEISPGRTLDRASASLVLSREELAFVESAVDTNRAFLTCWTRKEAFAKVDGRGLERDLASLTLTDRTGQPRSTNGYSLVDIRLLGAIAAVAAPTGSRVITR